MSLYNPFTSPFKGTVPRSHGLLSRRWRSAGQRLYGIHGQADNLEIPQVTWALVGGLEVKDPMSLGLRIYLREFRTDLGVWGRGPTGDFGLRFGDNLGCKGFRSQGFCAFFAVSVTCVELPSNPAAHRKEIHMLGTQIKPQIAISPLFSIIPI